MAASITKLPIEIVEAVARYLKIKDLYSLRLSQPAIFPKQTTDRLRQIHAWNALPYHRRHIHNSPCWQATDPFIWWRPCLQEIANHKLYHSWITSVYINCSSSYVTERKGNFGSIYSGVGFAITKLTSLTTLWIDGLAICNDRLRVFATVLNEMCKRDNSFALQHLVIKGADAPAKLLADFLSRHHSSLREVAMVTTHLESGSWTQDILPMLRRCNLRFLLIQNPTVSHQHGACRRDVVFRSYNKYDHQIECPQITFIPIRALKIPSTGLDKPKIKGNYKVTEAIQIKEQDNWEGGIKWLCKAKDAFWYDDTDSFSDHDCTSRRIQFSDWEDEMQYRELYRTAQANGQTLSGEKSGDRWFASSLDWYVTNKHYFETSQEDWGDCEELGSDVGFGDYVGTDSDADGLGHGDDDDTDVQFGEVFDEYYTEDDEDKDSYDGDSMDEGDCTDV